MRRSRLILSFGVIFGLICGAAAVPCAPASAEPYERNRPWQREPLRIALERLLAWNLGADIGIDALEGPLIPELVLRGVTVDVNGERLADIDSFRMRVDVWALFQDDTPFVELIELKKPVLTLKRGADGRWNIPNRGEAKTDDESTSFSELGIAEIDVSDGVLRIRDDSKALDLLFSLDIKGRSISLPWAAPENRATAAEVDVSFRSSQAFGERIDSGGLKLSLAAGILRVVDLEVKGSFGAVYADGELDVSRIGSQSWSQQPGRLVLSGTELRRGDLPLGDLDVKLTSPGGGIVRIESLALEGEVPIRVESGSEIRIAEGVSFERFAFSLRGQRVSVSGGIQTTGLRALRVATSGFRADVLGNLFDSPVALGGLVDAEFTLDGDFPNPTLTGRADWAHPRVSEVEIEHASATLETQANTLRVHMRAVDANRQILNSTATLPYLGDIRDMVGAVGGGGFDPTAILHSKITNLELEGDDIELALFEPFLARQLRDLSGRAKIQLSLRGARPQPHIGGSVDIFGAGVRVPLLRSTFSPIDGRIVFDGSAVVLHDLRIGAGDGEAIAVGRVELDRLIPASVDLKLDLRHFPLARSSGLRTHIGGELGVVGPLSLLAFTGTLALEDTRIRLPKQEDPLLREIHVIARSASDYAPMSIVEGAGAPGLYEQASFDLKLRIPQGTWVKGRGANLDLAGELAFRKRTLEAARYAGEVEVVRGTYTFQGRRFVIRRGTMSFDGGTAANPLIDIEASYRVSDVEIIAYLTGRALDPILRLESEPVLPESEVLHYLVFGRSSDEATGSDPNIGAAAGAFAAGVALSQITPLLEDHLPIDTLEILLPTDQSDGAIGVGKYVHKDVYVRYGRTLSRDPVDQVSIELRINKHWSLESQASSDENAGADLIWSFDF